MDYWEYLAHGQKGAERDDHRYYARELVGNRGGKNVYRYFYSAEEYASYRRSKGSHAGAATNEKESLLDKARKSHRENRWRPHMIISTGGAASVTYKNSAGKKRHTDYMGTDATRKAEREFNRKSDDNYEKNRDRMELVYQTDKALRRAKRKAQKLGIDIKRNAKKGASVVSNLLNRRKKKNTPSSSGSTAKKTGTSTRHSNANNSKRIAEQHSMDRKRWDTANRAAQVKKDAKAYRKKRRTASKATRNGQKRIMDNARERPYYSPKKV